MIENNGDEVTIVREGLLVRLTSDEKAALHIPTETEQWLAKYGQRYDNVHLLRLVLGAVFLFGGHCDALRHGNVWWLVARVPDTGWESRQLGTMSYWIPSEVRL